VTSASARRTPLCVSTRIARGSIVISRRMFTSRPRSRAPARRTWAGRPARRPRCRAPSPRPPSARATTACRTSSRSATPFSAAVRWTVAMRSPAPSKHVTARSARPGAPRTRRSRRRPPPTTTTRSPAGRTGAALEQRRLVLRDVLVRVGHPARRQDAVAEPVAVADRHRDARRTARARPPGAAGVRPGGTLPTRSAGNAPWVPIPERHAATRVMKVMSLWYPVDATRRAVPGAPCRRTVRRNASARIWSARRRAARSTVRARAAGDGEHRRRAPVARQHRRAAG
jgi:hypothetical protein